MTNSRWVKGLVGPLTNPVGTIKEMRKHPQNIGAGGVPKGLRPSDVDRGWRDMMDPSRAMRASQRERAKQDLLSRAQYQPQPSNGEPLGG